MLSIQLNPDVARRLAVLVRRTGRTPSDLVRQMIEENIDDCEDIQMASERLENRQPVVTTEQARKALGLNR